MYYTISYHEGLGRKQTLADKKKMVDSEPAMQATNWHWSYASQFCKNPWRSKDISYYRLTAVEKASKAVEKHIVMSLGVQRSNGKEE